MSCQSAFQLLFHWQAALTVFAGGKQSQIPAGVGIIDPEETKNSKGQPYIREGKCFYWLHTHAPDGVIHIESPVRRGAFPPGLLSLGGPPPPPHPARPPAGRRPPLLPLHGR